MTTQLSQIRDLTESLTSRTDIADSTFQLDCINAAQRYIQRKDIFQIGGSTTSLSSAAVGSTDVGNLAFGTTASGLTATGFPTDFRAYRDLVQTAPSNKSGFAKMTWEYANRVWRSAEALTATSNDIFQGVTVEGNILYLQPRFAATSAFTAGTWTFTLFYDAWLADLAATTDTNYLTNNAPDLIALFASVLILIKLRELDDASGLATEVRRMINELAKTEYQGTVAGGNFKLGDLQEMAMGINKAQLEQ